jgi:hypothetical protein
MILFCHVLATSCFGTYRSHHRDFKVVQNYWYETVDFWYIRVVSTVRILRILYPLQGTVIYFIITLVSRSSFMSFCISLFLFFIESLQVHGRLTRKVLWVPIIIIRHAETNIGYDFYVLKSSVHINNIQNSSWCRTENTACVHWKKNR